MSEPGPRRTDIDRLVLEAALLETRDRADFLHRQTLADPELLKAVRERLQVAAGFPSDFLAFPAADLLDAVTEVQGRGTGLDPGTLTAPENRYDLGEVLGQGGMATVQLAFDRHLKRQVALKFLSSDDDFVDRERFLEEARAQARVRHDHVLAIYDTGELDDRPFIAMHWVDGGTLADLPDHTSLEEKIRLVRQAADGLHAAHNEGLVHRDVKPSNLLVERRLDGKRVVRVSDFGIAFDSSQGSQGIAGTPAYLAPETLDLGSSVDRRVDVYGLGVTLFELLSGRLPFEGETVDELLRRAREQPAPDLAELVPTLPRDVAAIVRRCLEKDPDLRYGSAQAVSEELGRFLRGEPVEAVTATTVYRLSKFVVRHRRLLTLAAVASALLLVTSLVAAGLGVLAKVQGERADQRRGQAEGLISFMIGELRTRLSAVGRLDILDSVGEAALEYFAAVPEEELTDLELSRRSQALYQLGEVYLSQGKLDEALVPLQESLAGSRALLERAPDDPSRLFDVGQSEFWVGHAHFERFEHDATRPYWQRYLDVSERLIDIDPQNDDYRLELAFAHSNLASLDRRVGDLPSAIERFEKTLEINLQLFEAAPEDEGLLFELAASYNLLGLALLDTADLQAARHYLELELDHRRQLVERNPKHLGYLEFLGICRTHLAKVETFQGRISEAVEHFTEALDIFDRLVEHDPSNRLWTWNATVASLNTADVLLSDGWTAEAEPFLEDAVDLDAMGSEDPRLRKIVLFREQIQAELMYAQGDAQAAERKAADAVAQAEHWIETTPNPASLPHLRLTLLINQGRYVEESDPERARRLWRQALAHDSEACSEAGTFDHFRDLTQARILLGEISPSELANLRRQGYAHPRMMASLRARGLDRAPRVESQPSANPN